MKRADRIPWAKPWMLVLAALTATDCGMTVKRDLSSMPPGRVGFDDLCGVQGYFDEIVALQLAPPALLSAVDVQAQNRQRAGGRMVFRFESDGQLRHLRRVLHENWRRVPAQVDKAGRIDLEVSWAERAGLHRVATDREASIRVEGETYDLPYHACLSELLFGEPIYRNRRSLIAAPGTPAAQPTAMSSLR